MSRYSDLVRDIESLIDCPTLQQPELIVKGNTNPYLCIVVTWSWIYSRLFCPGVYLKPLNIFLKKTKKIKFYKKIQISQHNNNIPGEKLSNAFNQSSCQESVNFTTGPAWNNLLDELNLGGLSDYLDTPLNGIVWWLYLHMSLIGNCLGVRLAGFIKD